MATILESLRGLNPYPIPQATFNATAVRRGLNLNEEATAEVLNGASYNLAVADLLLWLFFAPSVSQGGQSYSFSGEQCAQFKNRAMAIYDEFEERAVKPLYGYKGTRL